jgi:putative ABC transport system ATP-binding protein
MSPPSSLFRAENIVIGPLKQELSFTLDAGRVIWITGPSGQGKTTLLRTLARLLAPEKGAMYLGGVPWTRIAPAIWRSRVLYTHQKATLFAGTVENNFITPFGLHVRKNLEPDPGVASSLMQRLLLPAYILDRDAFTLSVGESSRVALVRSLLVQPDVLLLDEITASLDPEARDAALGILEEWVSSGNRGIIAASHDETVRNSLPGLQITLGKGLSKDPIVPGNHIEDDKL